MYHTPTGTDNSTKLPLAQDAWMLFSFENHELVRLHLAPKECIEKHTNDWRIVFFVLRGKGSLAIEGKQFLIEEGQSIAIKPGLERSWHNKGKQVLELLAIKTREQP